MSPSRRIEPKLGLLLTGIALGVFACSSADSNESPEPEAALQPDDGPPRRDVDPARPDDEPDPPVEDRNDWESLIEGDWTMPPGEEGYVCVRHTVTSDTYVAAFEAINPPGTHHTLLTAGEPDGPDGVSICNAGTNHLLSLYGSGVGTNPMIFPDGVAVQLEAGTQLLLNLHLFNTTTESLSGRSGTRVRRMASEDVVHEAEGVLAGTIALELPPNQQSKHVGHCTMSHDVTVFAVAPHMHQLGMHAKVVAETGEQGEVLLHEGPYDFDQQLYYMVDPLPMKQGDRIRVECTYDNTTDRTVGFGDSSLDEMCFSGVYRYPARDSSFICLPE